MSYIVTKRIKGNPYLYQVRSERQGSRVRQVFEKYLGRADNVFPFVEQLDAVPVDVYNYKVIFKPESIIPDVDLSTSVGE